ncbi:MAG: TraR/DksA C4-type zinc finger protein [Gemmataceae bacterium]|nr:TraR/DksA C4-type zinc finger protein [Gemmataceae bacterium]
MDETRYCAICGEAIGAKRAKFLPHTRLCITHAREIDKLGGEFKLKAASTSLGKSGSLKKNYGDVSVTQSRNDDALRKLREQNADEGDSGG